MIELVLSTKHINKKVNLQDGDLIMTEHGGDWLLNYDSYSDFAPFGAVCINNGSKELEPSLWDDTMEYIIGILDREYTILEYIPKNKWHVVGDSRYDD